MAVFIGTWLVAVAVVADIEWSAETNPILGPDDPSDRTETGFTTALAGSPFDAAVGFFVQLVFAGPDNVIDSIPATVPSDFPDGTGAQGDDVVKSVRWIGAGRFVDTDGKFNAGNPMGDDPAGKYYIRAWSGPSQDAAKTQSDDPSARLPLPHEDVSGLFLWVGESSLVDYPEDSSPPSLVGIDFTATSGFLVDQFITVEQEKPEIVDLELALPDVTITWVSTPASSYDIESTGVLTNGASWAPLVQNVVATQTNTSFTANGVSDDALHFRVIPSP
jgi:hypothetical protein